MYQQQNRLYLSHQGLKTVAPIRALKGFDRVFIKAGQSKTVTFQLSPIELSIINADGKATQPAGKLLVIAGGCQPDKQTEASHQTINKTVEVI